MTKVKSMRLACTVREEKQQTVIASDCAFMMPTLRFLLDCTPHSMRVNFFLFFTHRTVDVTLVSQGTDS